MNSADKLAVEQHAADGWSVRRTARKLGLTVGQVIGHANRAGISFNGEPFGPKSLAMKNNGRRGSQRDLFHT